MCGVGGGGGGEGEFFSMIRDKKTEVERSGNEAMGRYH